MFLTKFPTIRILILCYTRIYRIEQCNVFYLRPLKFQIIGSARIVMACRGNPNTQLCQADTGARRCVATSLGVDSEHLPAWGLAADWVSRRLTSGYLDCNLCRALDLCPAWTWRKRCRFAPRADATYGVERGARGAARMLRSSPANWRKGVPHGTYLRWGVTGTLPMTHCCLDCRQ
jgi:hypothetical protein